MTYSPSPAALLQSISAEVALLNRELNEIGCKALTDRHCLQAFDLFSQRLDGLGLLLAGLAELASDTPDPSLTELLAKVRLGQMIARLTGRTMPDGAGIELF